MAGVKTDISLQINNTLNRTATFSLLGGTQDPSNGQANAKTLYEWDLTTETFANTNFIEIEASTVTNPQVITYTASNQDGSITDIQTVVNLLNTLNLGVFNLLGNTIWIIDDINVFGQVSVKIKLGFDIDDFVADAYAYFDPNGRTTALDFSNNFKPSIQSAVDNIPNFVLNIETQGWSCCWVGQVKAITLRRNVAGDVYLIGGANPPILVQNTDDLNSIGASPRLLYTANQNIYKDCDISLDCLDTSSNIFKFIFTGLVRFRGNSAFFPTIGWILLDPTYLQVNDGTYVNGGLQTTRSQYIVEELHPTYADFPNVDIGAGNPLTPPTNNLQSFASTSVTNPLVINGNNLSFGILPNNAQLNLDFLEITNAGTSTYFVNFNTLQLTDNFTTNFILNNFVGDTILTLDSAFNTKFGTTEYGSKSKNLTFSAQTGSNLDLQFIDFTTELRLNFTEEIQWSNLRIANKLPPIDQIGGFNSNGTEFDFFLNLSNQQIGATLTMGYYNDWFEKLGNQDWLTSKLTNVVGGGRDISVNGTYYLSGLGLIGLKKIQGYSDGFNSIIISANAEVTNSIYLSTLTNPTSDYVGVVFTRTGGAEPTIDYRYSSIIPNNVNVAEYQTDVIATSSTIGGLQYGCQLPSGGGAIGNTEVFNAVILLPVAFTNDNEVVIGASVSRIDAINSCYIESLDAGILSRITKYSINGLTLQMEKKTGLPFAQPTFTPTRLYNRNFGAISQGNIVFNHFQINTIDIEQNTNTTVAPYGSRKIFNFPVSANFNQIQFINCNFGTDNSTTDLTTDILSAFFDDNVYFPDTLFLVSDFNLGLIPASNSVNPTFNIYQDNGVPALIGKAEFNTVEFTQIATPVEVRLTFVSNYDGTGQTITNLIVDECDAILIELTGTRTATPPATALNISNNDFVTSLSFANHNVTALTFNGNPLLATIDLSNNGLDSAQLDILLNYVDGLGTSNGTLDYSNQSTADSPTIASQPAYDNLVARGWTITGNQPPLPSNFDISTYTQDTSVLFQKNNVSDGYFNEDGTIFFLSTSTNYEKYVLGTAFTLATIPATPTQSLAINTNPTFISVDGQVWDSGNYLFNFAGGVNEMRRWSFGTPNDLSTLGSLASSQLSTTTGGFSLQQGFSFSPTGNLIYNLEGLRIRQYPMTTNWDLSTLGTAVATTYASMGVTIPANETTKNLIFNTNGDKALIFASRFVGSVGIPLSCTVYQFSLTTPFDTSTMSYDNKTLDLSETGRTGVASFGTVDIVELITLYNNTGAFPQNSQEFIVRTPPAP